jgi:Fe-S cluster assembly protein SufD
MKTYQLLDKENFVIDSNENYLVTSNTRTILVKSGVSTNLLTYNKLESLNINITVEKDATVNLYQVVQNNEDTNISETVYLNETGATFNTIVVLLGLKNSVINSDIKIYHNTNNTNSDLKVYAVIKDEAKINLDNNAYIKKNSYQSKAYQGAKGLSLSKSGRILVNPNLFIDEYDVMASHGVAMGSLNMDDLFYLMSRGLTKDEASQIVIMGFIEPILVAIENEEITNQIRENFKQNLK